MAKLRCISRQTISEPPDAKISTSNFTFLPETEDGVDDKKDPIIVKAETSTFETGKSYEEAAVIPSKAKDSTKED